MEAVDYYRILGLTRDASSEEIRRAYRRLAREYHPDINPSAEAAEIFRQATVAYENLKTAKKRKRYQQSRASNQRSQFRSTRTRNTRYDFRSYQEQARRFQRHKAQQERQTGQTPPPRSDSINSWIDKAREKLNSLGELAKTSWFSNRLNRSSGDNALVAVSVVEVVVTVVEAIRGTTKNVELSGRSVSKKIQITVPAGVRTGSVIRLRSKTPPVEELIVIVRVAHHPYLSLYPRGLVVDVPVTVKEATLGGKIKIPTLSDRAVTFSIPPGTQSGREFRIPRCGIPKPDGTLGDLYARIMIEIPSDLPDSPEVRQQVKLFDQTAPRSRFKKRLV